MQVELTQAHGLAKLLLGRETLKKDNAYEVIQDWELRFAKLTCKFPSLSMKDDNELLHNKECMVRKPKTEAIGYVESLLP